MEKVNVPDTAYLRAAAGSRFASVWTAKIEGRR